MSYPRDPIHEAAQAHTSLVLFAKIAELAECSDNHGSYAKCQQIVRICQREQQRLLGVYDRAHARALKVRPQGDPNG